MPCNHLTTPWLGVPLPCAFKKIVGVSSPLEGALNPSISDHEPPSVRAFKIYNLFISWDGG